MTRVGANIPAPSGFRDGRPWLDPDPPTWVWPNAKLSLAEGEIPVRLEGREEPIGRVRSVGQDEQGLLFELDIDPQIAERLFPPPLSGFSIAK